MKKVSPKITSTSEKNKTRTKQKSHSKIISSAPKNIAKVSASSSVKIINPTKPFSASPNNILEKTQNSIPKKNPKDILLTAWETFKKQKTSVLNISVFTLLDDTERDKVVNLVFEKKGNAETLKTQALRQLLEIKITGSHSWSQLEQLGGTLNTSIDKVIDLIKKQASTNKPINLQMIIMPFITKEIDATRIKNAMKILAVDEITTRAILRFAKKSNLADIKLAQKYYDYAEEYSKNNAPLAFQDVHQVREALSFILSQEALTTSSRIVAPRLRLDGKPLKFRRYARTYLNNINVTWDNNQDVETNLNLWFDNFLIKESDDMWDRYKTDIDIKQKKINAVIMKDLTDPTQALDYWEWDHQLNRSIRRNGEMLLNDYNKIKNLLSSFEDDQDALAIGEVLPLQFNWSIFISDPFLSDIRESKLPQTITDEQITRICETILSCDTYNFEDQASIKNVFYRIKSTTYINQQERSHTLRKRMVRLVEYYTKGQTALVTNENIAYAKLGQLIAQNASDRCIDGIEQWLSEIEVTSIYKATNNNISSTLRFARDVSNILSEKKMSHIRSHIPPASELQLPNDLRADYNFKEIGTYAPLLLTQRLRLGFGLPTVYSSTKDLLLMQSCGGVNNSEMRQIYDPINVIRRFFKGGSITFTQKINSRPTRTTATVQFKAFSPDVFIQDIHQPWDLNQINNDVVTELILKDKVLRKAYLENSEGMGGDKYFDLSAIDKKDTFKPTVFKRLLTKTGYIVDFNELD